MPRTQQSAIKSTGGSAERKALPLAPNDDDWDMIDGPLSPLTTSSSSSPQHSPTTPAAELPGQPIRKRTQEKTVGLGEDVRYLFLERLLVISLSFYSGVIPAWMAGSSWSAISAVERSA